MEALPLRVKQEARADPRAGSALHPH